MIILDLFNTHYENTLKEGAVDATHNLDEYIQRRRDTNYSQFPAGTRVTHAMMGDHVGQVVDAKNIPIEDRRDSGVPVQFGNRIYWMSPSGLKMFGNSSMSENSEEPVGFHVDTELAYQAVMRKFGNVVSQDPESGTMYVPAQLWTQVEQVAFDADGRGAEREEGVAEGLPKDPNAPKLVQDRKTGKWYDPNKEFDKKMNSPEVMAQMKRMAQKGGVAEGLKSMYHNAVAKHHGRKADDAFDNNDEEGFAKHMDKSISHRLKAGEKIPQVRDPKKFQPGVAEGSLNELTDKLADYKTAAAADAAAADKRGDYKHGDKRFAGIVKATKKQFANDVKKHNQTTVKEESSTGSDAVEQAILKRIMVSHTDLLRQFGPDKVMQAVEEVAYGVGDVDEIGTSDVSAYVRQVRQILGAE